MLVSYSPVLVHFFFSKQLEAVRVHKVIILFLWFSKFVGLLHLSSENPQRYLAGRGTSLFLFVITTIDFTKRNGEISLPAGYLSGFSPLQNFFFCCQFHFPIFMASEMNLMTLSDTFYIFRLSSKFWGPWHRRVCN